MSSNKRKRGMSKELMMLSADLLPLADRDRRKRQSRAMPSSARAVVSPIPESQRDDDTVSEDDESVTPFPRRPALLDESDSSDEEYDSDYDSDDSDDSDDDIEEQVYLNEIDDDEDVNASKFVCPPRPKGKGKHSFEAIEGVNSLFPLDVLKGTFTNLMICPAIGCPSKAEGSTDYHTLETTHQQYGFATELYITCSACGWGTAICPLANQLKGDTPNSKKKKKKQSERDSERFHQYDVNYSAGFLMQKLGLGLRGLDLVFALLGIAPNTGSKVKWNRIANKIGIAEQKVAEEVMEENRKEELKLTLQKADEYMEQWLHTAEAIDANEDDGDRVRREFLYISKDGKYGITISCDGAWQKRKIGKNGGDSTTGHNFALGGYSKKIVGLQCYSKHCRLCEVAKKKNKVVKEHRCPRNYKIDASAKAMEAKGAVQHCVDIHNSEHNIYVATMVTDDDATTRSNVKHSYHDIIEKQHPGSKGEDGKIPPRKKRKLGWPTTSDNKLKPCNPGILPIWVEEAKRFFADPQHRCRCVGKAFFNCASKSNSKKKGDDGLLSAECERAKRAFGFYIKKNQCYPLEDFCKYAPCVFYHQFNMHHLCNIEWCTTLQNQQPFNKDGPINCNDDPTHGFDTDHCNCDVQYCQFVQNKEAEDRGEKPPHKIKYKYRNTDTKEEKKLYEKVYESVMWLLLPDKMKELWHPYNTQKNETLQRQAIALAPKDKFLGGKLTLYDRLRLIVVIDSLGEFEGMSRLHHAIGLPPLNPVMAWWATKKDNDDKVRKEYKKKKEVKRKRAKSKVEAMKLNVKADKRAKKEGITYESGIANKTDACELESPKKTD